MRTLVPFALFTLLIGCGRAPDPSFTANSGDLAVFLVNAISNRGPVLHLSNTSARIETTWHFRVLNDRHKSGEYLENREALQVATEATNFTAVESLLTSLLGQPALPLRREKGGWQHMGWNRTNQGVSIWLKQVEQQCQIEVVAPKAKTKS